MTGRSEHPATRTALIVAFRVLIVALPGAAAIRMAALSSPSWSRPLLVTAALALAASTAGKWPWTGTLAGAATVGLAGCAQVTDPGHVSAAILAVDGLLILTYLLVLDAVESTRRRDGLQPVLRRHLPAFAAGTAGALVATLSAAAPAQPALILATVGAAALAAASWLAIPRRAAEPPPALPARR